MCLSNRRRFSASTTFTTGLPTGHTTLATAVELVAISEITSAAADISEITAAAAAISEIVAVAIREITVTRGMAT